MSPSLCSGLLTETPSTAVEKWKVSCCSPSSFGKKRLQALRRGGMEKAASKDRGNRGVERARWCLAPPRQWLVTPAGPLIYVSYMSFLFICSPACLELDSFISLSFLGPRNRAWLWSVEVTLCSWAMAASQPAPPTLVPSAPVMETSQASSSDPEKLREQKQVQMDACNLMAQLSHPFCL